MNYLEQYELSWKPKLSENTSAILTQLKITLKKDISEGKLTPGTRLPSQRELAYYLDVHYSTIGKLYRWGVENGILNTSIGSGTFISLWSDASKTVSKRSKNSDIYDLGLVSSFDECNSFVIDAISKTYKNVATMPHLLSYDNPLGTDKQRIVGINWLKTQGVHADVDSMSIVSGAQNALAIILSTLFNPGDRIVVDDFTYVNFIELARLNKIELVPIKSDSEGMLPDKLLLEQTKKQISGAFLMPSCNNPLGFQISETRRKELAKIFEQYETIIIEDDIHSFLTTYSQKNVLSPFQQLLPNQTVYIASMSKFISPGIRIAFLVYPKNFKKSIEDGIFNINVQSSSLDAEIISNILTSDISQQILEKKFTLTKQANEIFDKYFNVPRPSNLFPFYRIIPLKFSPSMQEVENYFYQNGIQVIHSNRFSIKKEGSNFIRVSLSSLNSLEELNCALSLLAKCDKFFSPDVLNKIK
ncbi:PLP-dependent aminotransferase family protein [Weissella diestrammenae]|uniref:aminotransferase-like domain-containing protein n=1 Tax=Weissella diestrammenae TaxID=1162633 RepID=UPI001960BA67|nr:PLP-dependent aminotransferase family protein [Weissella diestrammenae]MCM0582182.1 PLP-dependent aminotransferase family protein [Weissella diestrammenae]